MMIVLKTFSTTFFNVVEQLLLWDVQALVAFYDCYVQARLPTLEKVLLFVLEIRG